MNAEYLVVAEMDLPAFTLTEGVETLQACEVSLSIVPGFREASTPATKTFVVCRF